MSKLRRYAPLPRQSQKVKAAAPDFRAVYTVVDERSGGRCEVDLLAVLESELRLRRYVDALNPSGNVGFRCTARATDHHHLYKPRRSHHSPELVVALCRHHHERVEWPYKKGRLAIALVNGVHTFRIVYAADKFALRSGATAS